MFILMNGNGHFLDWDGDWSPVVERAAAMTLRDAVGLTHIISNVSVLKLEHIGALTEIRGLASRMPR